MARRVPPFPWLALVLALGGPARAGDAPPIALPAALGVEASEAKALLTLLRSAVKEDFRRQAWWLAGRLLVVQPGQEEARDVRSRWKEEDLALGRRPTKAWARQRDAALAKVGDAWAALAREGRGERPAGAAAIASLERALLYGTKAPDAKAALESAGRLWAGTWGAPERATLEKALGDRIETVTFEPEFDDDLLEVRALWPESRAARVGDWRLFTTGDLEAAGRALVLLAAQEQDFVVRLGSHAKPPKDPDEDAATDLLLAPDAKTYDRLVPLFFAARGRANLRWEGTSGVYGAWQRRMVVLAKDRDNPWTPEDANLLAWAARGLVRRHLAPDAGGWLSGRGAWVVDGLAVLYEGFRREGAAWDLDPARSWHLAAARALKDRWIPWARLVEMDREAVETEPRVDLEVEFGGAKQKGVKVDAVLSQAAALAAGVARADPKQGGGWPRLAALVEETYKRDRLPDLEKAFGGRAKAILAAAAQAADAATGGEAPPAAPR